MGAYSLYVGPDRLGWSFRSLLGARYNAVTVCAASGLPVSVVDDLTGAVMYAFERDAAGGVCCSWEDPDAAAIAYPPEKCFYNVSPAPAVGA